MYDFWLFTMIFINESFIFFIYFGNGRKEGRKEG